MIKPSSVVVVTTSSKAPKARGERAAAITGNVRNSTHLLKKSAPPYMTESLASLRNTISQ
jgi:hypothetical protein